MQTIVLFICPAYVGKANFVFCTDLPSFWYPNKPVVMGMLSYFEKLNISFNGSSFWVTSFIKN